MLFQIREQGTISLDNVIKKETRRVRFDAGIGILAFGVMLGTITTVPFVDWLAKEFVWAGALVSSMVVFFSSAALCFLRLGRIGREQVKANPLEGVDEPGAL